MQQKNGNRKNYVLDTNVLLHDPACIHNFKGNNVILPMVVLEEIDSLKSRDGLCGCQARQAVRELSQMVEGKAQQSIQDGIELEKNIILKIEMNGYHNVTEITDELDLKKNDNRILLTTLSIKKRDLEIPTILVSKDICMRLKAQAFGIETEDYETDRIALDDLYRGYVTATLSSENIDKIYDSGLACPKKLRLFPNQFLLIHAKDSPARSVVARFDGEKLVPLQFENRTAWGLTPLNLEQKMAFELMMDDSVKFVSLTGGAGSGKTILATAVALEKVIEQHAYRKIVFVRPVVPAGDDIGFLPGNEEEKLRPWMGSFYDAFENLMYCGRNRKPRKNCMEDNTSVDAIIENLKCAGTIDMKTFTYMRGRTLTDAFVIVDEAQETTPHIAKLMMTRAGQNSKFVFIGDPTDNQIDNALVDSRSNGLVYLVERLKESALTGHVTLSQVERSPLARLAENAL
ncbi:PhoH family protein [Clostridium sp. KNHs216]|uniref:PhoH family protein n=1 Tax=Eubacteriales TaxID=186802 RepID=UPI0011511FFB|nr:PhoH family protein [Clostridium sp. KNHs216]TQI66417.1 PhoH-like ATPase [Clostridium sp. KNHs216]